MKTNFSPLSSIDFTSRGVTSQSGLKRIARRQALARRDSRSGACGRAAGALARAASCLVSSSDLGIEDRHAAELLVVDRLGDGRMVAADRAVRIAADFERAEFHVRSSCR